MACHVPCLKVVLQIAHIAFILLKERMLFFAYNYQPRYLNRKLRSFGVASCPSNRRAWSDCRDVMLRFAVGACLPRGVQICFAEGINMHMCTDGSHIWPFWRGANLKLISAPPRSNAPRLRVAFLYLRYGCSGAARRRRHVRPVGLNPSLATSRKRPRPRLGWRSALAVRHVRATL